jgi:hypothetical protein
MMDEREMSPVGAIAWLRVEGLVVAVAAVAGYALLHTVGWGFFVLLFFLPDLSIAGYIAGPRVGAVVYNIAHTYATATIAAGVGWLLADPRVVAVGLIWIAHIGFDRSLGYGLKLPAGFRYTHLGPIGRGGTLTQAEDGHFA